MGCSCQEARVAGSKAVTVSLFHNTDSHNSLAGFRRDIWLKCLFGKVLRFCKGLASLACPGPGVLAVSGLYVVIYAVVPAPGKRKRPVWFFFKYK